MTEQRAFAIFLLLFFVMGMLLVRFPMTMLRHMLTEKQRQQIEDERSVAAIARLIGAGLILFVFLALLRYAR